MRSFTKLVVAGFLALSVGSWSSGTQAADSGPTVGQQLHQVVPMLTTGVETLLNSRSQFGSDLVTLGSGFQAIDAGTTLTCPAGKKCLIRAEQNLQVRGSAASNRWAICTQVDGVFMAKPSCPYQGLVPADGTYVAGSFAQNATVGAGVHTLRTFLYTDAGADRSIYEVQYQIYRF
jgi:hypothetical protein